MTQPVDYEEGKRLLKGIVEQKAHISTDPAIAYDGYEQGLLESRRELLSRFMLTHAEALLNPDPWRPISELEEKHKDGRLLDLWVGDFADGGFRIPDCKWGVPWDPSQEECWLELKLNPENENWSWLPIDFEPTHFREIKGPEHV